jgi:rhodanese-related sulfurtransferase
MSTSKSFVLETPAAPPDDARRYLLAKLAAECDAWDVHEDRRQGCTDFVVIDARTAASYADMRIPGALLLPSRSIGADTVGLLKGKVAVVYGWGIGCNAGTKAALRLATLGVLAKEIIGGLEAWVKNGYPVEGTLPVSVAFERYLAWHHGHDVPYRDG